MALLIGAKLANYIGPPSCQELLLLGLPDSHSNEGYCHIDQNGNRTTEVSELALEKQMDVRKEK